MPIPKELEKWVATDDDEPTSITDPCYVDYRVVDELAPWLPSNLAPDKYRFKHVAAEDAIGTPFVKVDYISADWPGKLATVMKALKLYPRQVEGIEVLIDEKIGDLDTPLMDGWKIVHWQVAIGLGTKLEEVHHDFITWRRMGDGKTAESIFSWLPYKPS
jgi:hypothetical protein